MIWACGRKREHPPLDKISAVFGDWLRLRRHELDLTLDDISEVVGSSRSSMKQRLSHLESGRRNLFNMKVRDFIKVMYGYRVKPEAGLKRLTELLFNG